MTQDLRRGGNIIRLPDVMVRTGLAQSTIYALIRQGRFPKPIVLGLRAVGWGEDEIHDWVLSRIEASRKKTT